MFSVAIVGGGVAGASTAYYLLNTQNYKGKVILIESGEIGRGVDKETKFQTNHIEKQFINEDSMNPWRSGTNVFDNPNRIKMIVTIFPSTAEDFAKHHGKKGLELSHKITSTGRDLQIKLASSLMNDGKVYNLSQNKEIPDTNGVIQLGSLMVCYKDEIEEFENEFKLLKEAGFEVEWYDKKRVDELHGENAGFYAGIFFPKDGVINSMGYTKKLVEFCKKNFPNQFEVQENTHVTHYEQLNDKKVLISLDNGTQITSDKLVVSTGGLFTKDHNLFGILIPCYSYLTTIKNEKSDNKNDVISTFKNTPNYFTFGFSHDWSISQGKLRISGEDHFSALKPPRKNFRCKNMQDWTCEKYPHFNKIEQKDIQYIDGVYSETPDILPLVGKLSEDSSIVYFLGCNAWGQAILSGIAPMIPALLGARKCEKSEEELLEFIDIKRFKKTERTYLKAKF